MQFFKAVSEKLRIFRAEGLSACPFPVTKGARIKMCLGRMRHQVLSHCNWCLFFFPGCKVRRVAPLPKPKTGISLEVCPCNKYGYGQVAEKMRKLFPIGENTIMIKWKMTAQDGACKLCKFYSAWLFTPADGGYCEEIVNRNFINLVLVDSDDTEAESMDVAEDFLCRFFERKKKETKSV